MDTAQSSQKTAPLSCCVHGIVKKPSLTSWGYLGAKEDKRRRAIEGWIKVLFTQSNKVEFFKAKSKLLALLPSTGPSIEAVQVSTTIFAVTISHAKNRGSQEAALVPRTVCRNRSRRTLREVTQGIDNFHTGDIDADELNMCIVCEDTQPPLDDPADED
ncbi:unnamed protein product, partial [Strongylus vulgaris]